MANLSGRPNKLDVDFHGLYIQPGLRNLHLDAIQDAQQKLSGSHCVYWKTIDTNDEF